jgi:hypothetical protein
MFVEVMVELELRTAISMTCWDVSSPTFGKQYLPPR